MFHRGASKQTQHKDKLISNKSKLLICKEKDRAIITCKSLQDKKKKKTELADIVTEWICAAK